MKLTTNSANRKRNKILAKNGKDIFVKSCEQQFPNSTAHKNCMSSGVDGTGVYIPYKI